MQITDDMLAAIADIPALTAVDVGFSSHCTRQGLMSLARLTNLHCLSATGRSTLDFGYLDANDMVQIAAMPKLVVLEVRKYKCMHCCELTVRLEELVCGIGKGLVSGKTYCLSLPQLMVEATCQVQPCHSFHAARGYLTIALCCFRPPTPDGFALSCSSVHEPRDMPDRLGWLRHRLSEPCPASALNASPSIFMVITGTWPPSPRRS